MDSIFISSDVESQNFYEKQFLAYCEDNLPGVVVSNSDIYMKCRVASYAFAQSMMETNNPEIAYSQGLEVLFSADMLN